MPSIHTIGGDLYKPSSNKGSMPLAIRGDKVIYMQSVNSLESRAKPFKVLELEYLSL